MNGNRLATGVLYGGILVAGVSVVSGALRRKKEKRRAKNKASRAASRVLYSNDQEKILDVAKSLISKSHRCTVMIILNKELRAPWRKAALKLAAEYPQAFWVGTSSPDAMETLADNEDWSVGVWTEAKMDSEPVYSSTGTDQYAMAREMEKAVLHCVGGG